MKKNNTTKNSDLYPSAYNIRGSCPYTTFTKDNIFFNSS